MKNESCDLFKKIPQILIKEVFKKSPEVSAEMDYTFLGFEEVYQRVKKEVPEYMTIIDFGCAYAFQSWYFKDYAGYIAIDSAVPPKKRFIANGTMHYYGTIQDFIGNFYIDMIGNPIFAVCSYVPDEEAREMVVKNFRNHYVYYPKIIDDWRGV